LKEKKKESNALKIPRRHFLALPQAFVIDVEAPRTSSPGKSLSSFPHTFSDFLLT